jgi:hypothetical protein
MAKKTITFNTRKGPVSFKTSGNPKSKTKAAKTATKGR